VVFCEVKTRSSIAFGDPAEAVTDAKVRRVRALALQWLTDHPGHWDEVRFDVISVLFRGQAPAQIRHVRGAF
jgi:putative endonuclease